MNELLQQIVQLVLAAMSGDLQANQLIQVIMQKALQGDEQAKLVAQMIQAVALQMQQKAKFGAKLTYLKTLKGECPEGYELRTFAVGGSMGTCKKCMKKAEGGSAEQPKNVAEAFKCGRKMKKKAEGGPVEEEKCGGKAKKHLNGGTLTMNDLYDFFKCGGKTKKAKCGTKVKKGQQGTAVQEPKLEVTHNYKTMLPGIGAFSGRREFIGPLMKNGLPISDGYGLLISNKNDTIPFLNDGSYDTFAPGLKDDLIKNLFLKKKASLKKK